MDLLTDLEGAALAEIASRSKATSYAIAQAFSHSPSEYWSGSAGAVYPLVKRLAERGLLEPSPATTGMRARIDYRITPQGHSALEDWLLDARRASGMGFDPLRAHALCIFIWCRPNSGGCLSRKCARCRRISPERRHLRTSRSGPEFMTHG